MPIYEHACSACKVQVENIFTTPTDTAPTCPVCRKPMTKQVSQSSFALKGRGWAADGYQKG